MPRKGKPRVLSQAVASDWRVQGGAAVRSRLGCKKLKQEMVLCRRSTGSSREGEASLGDREVSGADR